MSGNPRQVAFTKAAALSNVTVGPDRTVILALAVADDATGHLEAFQIGADDAATAAVALLQQASIADPADRPAYDVDGVSAVVGDEGYLFLTFRFGSGRLPLALEPAVIADLKKALAALPDAGEATPPKRTH